MSRTWHAALLGAALWVPTAARAGAALAAGDRRLADREAQACAAELAAVEAREQLVASAPAPDLHTGPLAEAAAALDACVAASRAEAARAEEELELRREAARRLRPSEDTPERRAEVARELRLERARARAPERRTAQDEALLAAERARKEAEAIERTWAADPRVRRTALSASYCQASQEQRDAQAALADAPQERDGARQRSYALQSRARRADGAVAARSAQLAPFGGALPCAEPLVALLARCLQDGDRPPACEGAEVGAYLRLAR